jgi:hypothetical protein
LKCPEAVQEKLKEKTAVGEREAATKIGIPARKPNYEGEL